METKTIAWIGASTDMPSQEEEILLYAKKTGMRIDAFIQSPTPDEGPPGIEYDALFAALYSGNTLVVSGLSMLGRSIHEVIRNVKRIIDMDVRVIAVHQDLDLASRDDMSSKIRIDMLHMLYNVQQEIVSRRTRHGLDARKKSGIKLGRPKGSTGKSKLDPHKKEIAEMLKHRAPLSYIARVYGVTWPTVENFIRTRELDKPGKKTAQSS